MTWAVHSDVDQSDLNTVTTMSAPYMLHSASNWVHHLDQCSVLSHSSNFFHTTQLRYRILISFHYLFSFLLYTYMFTIILCVYIYSFANLANWFYYIFYLAIIIHPVLLSISYILTPPFFMFLVDLWHFINILIIISLSCCLSVDSTDVKFSQHLVFHLPGAAFKNNIHAGCVPENELLKIAYGCRGILTFPTEMVCILCTRLSVLIFRRQTTN